MKKSMVGCIGLMALSVFLSACSSFFKSRDNAYLQSQTGPVLQVSANVSSAKLGEDYPVSGSMAEKQAPSLLPPGSLAASRTK